MNVEMTRAARTPDGTRAYVALRGNVRDRIDREICLNPDAWGYGIGRSAFIAAALDLAMGLDDIATSSDDVNGETLHERFERVARMYESALPR